MAFTPLLWAGMKKNLNKAKDQLGDLCYPMPCDVSNLASIPAFIDKVINNSDKLIYW